MAESLSHIATILGPDVAERELLNTLDRFLQDDAKVRKKVIENLVDLLAALGPECRESYLAVLAEVMQSTANLSWRFRMLLGKQLPQLSRLFSPMATYGVVVKILFALLDDDVADVRLSTLAGIPHVLTRVKEIKEHPSWFDALIERLCKFESSPTYNKRLMFVKMCIPIASLISWIWFLCKCVGFNTKDLVTCPTPSLTRISFFIPLYASLTASFAVM